MTAAKAPDGLVRASRRHGSTFSITAGGPFFHLLTRLHLRTPAGKVRFWWVGLVLWLPLMLGELVRVLFGATLDPMVRDYSVHARLLFAVPMLLSSELILLERTVQSAITSLYHGKFCDTALFDHILVRAEKLRDSWAVELVLLVTAVVGGQLALWGVFGTTGLVHGGEGGAFWSFPRVWYTVVALPFVQFLMLRWLWRWGIWSYVLARISRLPLDVLATHADLAGGLAALARPVTGFSGFVLAIGAILSSAWATLLLAGRTTIEGLLPLVVAFLVSALVVAMAPLLSLTGHLFRARRRTLAQYGDFMRYYVLKFHAKWIESPAPEQQPLGTSDIQSLADLGNSYSVASRTRFFVFGPRNVLTVWFAGMLPMLPLLLTTVTIEQVLKRIVTTVLGGLPL